MAGRTDHTLVEVVEMEALREVVGSAPPEANCLLPSTFHLRQLALKSDDCSDPVMKALTMDFRVLRVRCFTSLSSRTIHALCQRL